MCYRITENHRESHMKTPVMESIFIKIASLFNFMKKRTLRKAFPYEFREGFRIEQFCRLYLSSETTAKAMLEAVVPRCSVKKIFLEISLNSQENTCASISSVSQLYWKETLTQVFSCEFCEISQNTFYYRTPLVAASEILKYALTFSLLPAPCDPIAAK